jgi:hypothetical protein
MKPEFSQNTSKFTKNLIRRKRVVPSWWTDRQTDGKIKLLAATLQMA